MSKEVARGRVGLNNLGNTCFMNAAIQLLLHAPEIIVPFLDAEDNPIEGQTNNKYKMVREFAKMARIHYSNTVKTQNPQSFRKSIKNIASFLCDGDQHDSHELLNFILQGLEEELTRKAEEAIRIDNNFIPDDGMEESGLIQDELYMKAKDWWRSYQNLNNCFITDQLYGEICNRIQCTQCKKCTYNYSSFNTLYVPVKKSSAVINITLIIQQFCADTNEFNIQYFTIPISVKANDHLKMLDMRLHERLSFHYGNVVFSSTETVNSAIFEDAKILYLLGTVTKERSYEFTRLTMDRSLSDFTPKSNSMIFAYITPPQKKGSIPVFLHFSLFRSIKSNGNVSSQPLENFKIFPLLMTPPLLLTVPKTDSVGVLKDIVSVLMIAAQEGRIYSNLNDHTPSNQYEGVYSRIPITVDYFYQSPFFPTARATEEDGVNDDAENASEIVNETVSQTVDEAVSQAANETVGQTANETSMEDVANSEAQSDSIVHQETSNQQILTTTNSSAEETNEPAKQLPTTEPETIQNSNDDSNHTPPSKPRVQFPRFYLSSLHSFNGLIPYLSTLVDSTENDSLSLSEAFDAVNSKADYRCILVATGITGQISEFDQTFLFRGEKNRKKLTICLMDRMTGHFSLSVLREETDSSSSGVNRSWGKGKKTSPAESTQLCLRDCLELKKPTMVLLGKNSTCQHCHQSTTIETTPFLARLPPLLLIQLKRFKYSMSISEGLGSRKGRSLRNQSFGRQKIDSFIDCPIKDWDISEYLLESLKETIPDPQMMHYELIGVINHSGTADFGHYYSYCKDGFNGGDNWFEYNDASVSAVKEENVITKNAYVLMYRRKDLGKTIYSQISGMSISVPGAKKVDVDKDPETKEEKPMEMKLERNRKDGIDNERKDVKDSVDSMEPIRKKRLSITERKLLKKMEKETKRKGKYTV